MSPNSLDNLLIRQRSRVFIALESGKILDGSRAYTRARARTYTDLSVARLAFGKTFRFGRLIGHRIDNNRGLRRVTMRANYRPGASNLENPPTLEIYWFYQKATSHWTASRRTSGETGGEGLRGRERG